MKVSVTKRCKKTFSSIVYCLQIMFFLSLEIEKQAQLIQAQRSNLPKVDVGEKVIIFSWR